MYDIKFSLIEVLENEHKKIPYVFDNNIIKMLIDFLIAYVY